MRALRVGITLIGIGAVCGVACGGADGGAEDLKPGGGNGFDVDAGGDGSGGGGLDGAVGDGAGIADTGNRCGKTLTGVIRDFKEEHPDFEYKIGDDLGIVQEDLGADGKPVWAGGTHPTVTTKESFDQWFRDVPGVNQAIALPITLSKVAGELHTFDDGAFFPIDGKGFGNEGHEHNFHFTYELHTTFLYAGGETFKFTGDDDLFVFINKKLAIDLGGVHGSTSGEVALDDAAGKLGLTKGKVYALDFFFAERHTSESHFRIDTTLDFVSCGDGIK
ncbi:MAG: fibro-slime domain-containing protein [Deltaproteobacteria bacterium]|nr:fibro-slime domain-containing protein [Deltaproteobacteria bacterium]